jgi:hypothetical protein
MLPTEKGNVLVEPTVNFVVFQVAVSCGAGEGETTRKYQH